MLLISVFATDKGIGLPSKVPKHCRPWRFQKHYQLSPRYKLHLPPLIGRCLPEVTKWKETTASLELSRRLVGVCFCFRFCFGLFLLPATLLCYEGCPYRFGMCHFIFLRLRFATLHPLFFLFSFFFGYCVGVRFVARAAVEAFGVNRWICCLASSCWLFVVQAGSCLTLMVDPWRSEPDEVG